MAARDWFIGGVQVFEESEEEYFVEGVQFQEDPVTAGEPSNLPLLGVG